MGSAAESQPKEDHAQGGASTELQKQGKDVPRLLQLLVDFGSGEKERDKESPENDFSNADLSHGDFQGKDLTGINFSAKDPLGLGMGTAVNLENANLIRAHLENAKLGGAHLKNANLKWAHLENANLNSANLENANLNKANLKNANLRKAHLENANLKNANLENANLRKAHLENANLKNANLAAATFRRSDLKGAIFEEAFINTDTDFSRAKFSLFRPPRSRASRASGTWRTKAVAKSCGFEIINHCLSGDAEGSDEEDDEDDDEDDDEAGAADAESANDDGILQKKVEDKINQCVAETVGVLKQAIPLVNLLLETVKLTLKESLKILKTVPEKPKNFSDKNEVETYIKKKVSTIMALLVDKFFIATIKRLCEDNFNISHERIMSLLRDNLEDFGEVLLKELQTTDVTIDNWIDRNNLDILESAEIEQEYPNESQPAAKNILKEIGEALRAEALHTLRAETDRVLQDIFILYNDDLEAGRTKIKSVSEVLTALLDPMHKKLKKLLSSGIEGILSKFLTNHCNSEIQKLAQMTKNRIEMAEKFEEILIEKCNSLGNKMNAYFPKGTFKRNMIKFTLNAATKYSVKVGGGQEATIHTMISAVRLSRVELKTTEAELGYLLDKLVKIEEMDVTVEKWRDAAQTWMSLIDLRAQLKGERSIAVINCIASDEKVLDALSAAKALLHSIGGSNTIVSILSNEPGRHIRENGYRYQRTIRREIAQIQKIREFQVLLISFIGTAIASAFIALFNYLFRFAGGAFNSWWQLPLIMIGGIMGLIMILSIIVWCCKCEGKRRRRSGGRGRKQEYNYELID
jgi:uncharacterized protein YjbI with pentapeptide repeats